jgi:hypothetical protein
MKKKIAGEYLKYVSVKFEYVERVTDQLFGRPIKHILLLHANELNADYFAQLIEVLKSRGYRFISLDEGIAGSRLSIPGPLPTHFRLVKSLGVQQRTDAPSTGATRFYSEDLGRQSESTLIEDCMSTIVQIDSRKRRMFWLAALAVLLAVSRAPADDGYRLWLRYDRLPANAIAKYQPRVRFIVVAGDSATMNAIRAELVTDVQDCSAIA